MKFKETKRVDDIFGLHWEPGREIPAGSVEWHKCLELMELGWNQNPNPVIHRHYKGHQVLSEYWVECE
jgi:hypothetical protein